MAVREIIRIDEDKCDGCGDCVTACAEGAIRIVDGKARLVSETYCDGLGACLGHCPQEAITIEKREAPDYDETAVAEHLADGTNQPEISFSSFAACPGAAMRRLSINMEAQGGEAPPAAGGSQLGHWPVQLMLIPPHAPFLQGADLLICADCVPFAVPDFHSRYLAGRAVVVGCPKLDDLQVYFEKLREIFRIARPRRITVLRMEVPCCGGIAQAAIAARDGMAPDIPLEVHTIGIRGEIEVRSSGGAASCNGEKRVG